MPQYRVPGREDTWLVPKVEMRVDSRELVASVARPLGGQESLILWTRARHSSVYPREPDRVRLPVRDKLYCEALAGVADPVTTCSREVSASTQEGGQCWFPAKSSTQQSSTVSFRAANSPKVIGVYPRKFCFAVPIKRGG